MILTNTRPQPPWILEDHYLTTFLTKEIRTLTTPADAPLPGVLNVEYAREYIYLAPKAEWEPSNG